ncbi:NAD-dependent epimerase/dehydratase family protein [Maribacter algarum]|uniref:NAD-dependent epimerase/dehydratase family protein n=1 Tax=Maribacter algarum (ex Zhang et al. 2020) TaxID=2578118 RepID=A0A5S3PWK8_9FLAO|nr:NAD-dependent epimerase/dehydratase family protein [Maribacter algarum]TMM59385.1 NAD-dependent epimerase/dehydratase family protein [Maribacter algarum]
MILVTGGTGLVGAHLLLHLLQKGMPVRAIHRKGSDLKRVEKVFGYYSENASELFAKIEWVVADLNDIPDLQLAFNDIQYVYHAAALISFNPSDYKKLLKINAEGTANIVNLCVANDIKKLCYVSTIGTIGKSIGDAPATEENEWNDLNVNVYALSKYEAEMEVWRGSQEGLSVVMLNPGVILGPGFWETGTGALFTAANKGYSFYPPGGTGFITVHDVIKMMTLLMESQIENERFIAVAENLTFQEILTRLTTSLGKSAPKKKLKYWQLEMGRIGDLIWSTLTGNPRKITKSSIHSLKHRDFYENQKIREALDFTFESLDPTLTFSCRLFLEENP